MVDTTGAGDAFMAGILYGLVRIKKEPDFRKLLEIARFANEKGAIAVTRKGAV